MKKLLILTLALGSFASLKSQVYNTNPDTNEPLNAVNNFISGNSGKRVSVGAYAQIDYNQAFNDSSKTAGNMDVHRFVALFGYQFNDKTYFVSEIEMEHVQEVYVEQAFLSHQFNPKLSLRAGLMLIPMGIINEYHEPVTYNGVERPNVDKYIVPTTWREMGAGFTGKFDELSLKYQVYVVNGFLGYDEGGKLRGSDGLRKGRQKGAESVFSSPNFSMKWDYYGLPGLKLGLAGYYGDTQTTAHNNVVTSNSDAVKTADSTVVNVGMAGFDFRYQLKGFQSRGQFIYSSIGNTDAYNSKTGSDLGSAMTGFLIEAGYDVLELSKKEQDQRLVAFARFENYDTHAATDGIERNKSYNRNDITVGLGWHLAQGAVLKADYQIFSNGESSETNQAFNMGVGIWF